MSTYSEDIKRRIGSALAKARASGRNTWFIGESPDTGVKYYKVTASKGNDSYSVSVHPTKRILAQGFNYCQSATGRGDVENLIGCTCPAGVEFHVPCKHAAKVYLRLAREAEDALVQDNRMMAQVHHEH